MPVETHFVRAGAVVHRYLAGPRHCHPPVLYDGSVSLELEVDLNEIVFARLDISTLAGDNRSGGTDIRKNDLPDLVPIDLSVE
ncbi:hypothetical protein D9M70_501990 [compost metagenome]